MNEDVEATGSEGSLLGKEDRQASSSGGVVAAPSASGGACEESVAAALDSWALWAIVSLLILVDLIVLLRQATASAGSQAAGERRALELLEVAIASCFVAERVLFGVLVGVRRNPRALAAASSPLVEGLDAAVVLAAFALAVAEARRASRGRRVLRRMVMRPRTPFLSLLT